MAKQQKFEVMIPEGLNGATKKLIASALIEHIRYRTQAMGNSAANAFPEYGKGYAKRKGVGRGDVDLTLSGEMLEKLQLLRAKKDRLVIGYKKGDPINGKVEGNQLGSYGKSPNKKKARPFLDFKGSEKRERARIIRENIGQ